MPIDLEQADHHPSEASWSLEDASVVLNGVTYVIAPSSGGVRVYSVDGTGVMTLVFNLDDNGSLPLGYATTAAVYQTGGVTYVYVQAEFEGIGVYTMASDGSLTLVASPVSNADLGTIASAMLAVFETDGVTYLVAHGNSSQSANLYTIGNDGIPHRVQIINDDGNMALSGWGDHAILEVGGVTYVAMRSSNEGIALFAMQGGQLVHTASIYAGGYYGLNGAVVGGSGYLVSHNGAGLAVYSIGAGGTLTQVNQVGSDSLFGFVQIIENAGTTYVLASASTGIEVFTLSAAGALTYVETAASSSGGIGEMEVVTVDGKIIVFATAQGGNVTFTTDLLAGPSVTVIPGTGGNDVLPGTSGDDEVNAGDGNDKVLAGDGNDTVNGEGGNDDLRGENGDDTLNGGAGTDKLQGGVGNDTLNGGDDNDTLIGGDGDDDLDGGAGNDLVQGNAGADDLLGGTGDDRLEGGADNDTLDGGDGVDMLIGGGGDDTYYNVTSADTVVESANGGYDIVRTAEATYTLTAHVEELVMLGGAVTGIGNSLNNLITGTDNANELSGMGGNDRIFGFLGADSLNGGDGDDYLDGGDDDDTLAGGAGGDRLLGGNGADTLDGDAGDDFLEGGDGGDTVRGGLGNDYILATRDGWADLLQGGDGNDIIETDDFSDMLDGGAGDDSFLISVSKLAAPIGKALPTALLPSIADSGGTDTVSLFGGVGPYQYTLGAGLENLNFQGPTGSLAIGNSLNNTITGNANGATLRGEGGNDTLIGGGSSVGNEDILIGGDGNDTYILGDADQATTITETSTGGTDTVINTGAYVVLQRYVENLTIAEGNAGGGEGNGLANLIKGSNLGNRLLGMDGADTIYGNGGNDEIDGGAGDDTLFGGDGDDQVRGGSGNDAIDGGVGADTMIGGAGNDTYKNVGLGDVIVEDHAGGTDTVLSLTDYTLSENLENLTLIGSLALVGIGNAAENSLKGNAFANTLSGLGGNDSLDGAAGADDLDGGDGDDALRGGADNDSLHGGLGRDDLRGDAGDDFIEGGDGADKVDGGDGDDEIRGDAGNDNLKGGAGEDHLYGGADADVLDGGAGNDILEGGLGNDTYYIGQDGRLDAVVEDADAGIDTVSSGASIKTLFNNVENLILTGTALHGGGNELANKITGNIYNNSLYGFGGNDVIDGGTGDDVINGGDGNDTLTGGKGADTFVFDSAIALSSMGGIKQSDSILDFNFAQGDVIDLSRIDANALLDGHQSMLLVDMFHKTAGEAVLAYSAAKNVTTLSLDIDGDGKADFVLTVNGNQLVGGSTTTAPKGWLFDVA